MLDRASTFADPEIVEMLKVSFVPVAIDQAYQRRQKDTEGEFYRRIASQGPRSNFRATTQGFYIATAAGELLLYNNNRDPAKVRRLMKKKLAEFKASEAGRTEVAALEVISQDQRYNVKPPEGGLVVRVHTRVLGGYEPSANRWRNIMQNALGRDNLWISRGEHQSLARGEFPVSLQRRLARFHLVDNTRGEPPMWKANQVTKIDLRIDAGRLSGKVELKTEAGERGYQVEMLGFVETKAGKVVRFDLIAKGEFWGEGRYTRNAPKGRFPLAVAFRLADGSDVADAVPPQGSRGWLAGYMR